MIPLRTSGRSTGALALLAILVLMSSIPASSFGAYSLKEILSKEQIERAEPPPSTPIRLARVESAAGGGWSGALDDRWHSSDAFRGPFRDEFLDGLTYYLEKRGYVVTSSPEALLVKVTIDGFEGRKRIHDDGGDLRGTLTLVRGGQAIGKKELFESLSYRDESDERPVFQKQYDLPSVQFSTVLFYRLSLSFFKSIDAGITGLLETERVQGGNGGSKAGSLSTTSEGKQAKQEDVGLLTIESIPMGAEILLDGNLIAMTPAKQLRLPAGGHTLVLKKAGYQDWIRDVMILGGNDVAFTASLEKSSN